MLFNYFSYKLSTTQWVLSWTSVRFVPLNIHFTVGLSQHLFNSRGPSFHASTALMIFNCFYSLNS